MGDCPTPWPCFVIAASQAFLDSDRAGSLAHILDTINMYTAEFKSIPSIDRTLSNRYGQSVADIQLWLTKTQWSQSQLPKSAIQTVQQTLLDLGLIDKTLPAAGLLR